MLYKRVKIRMARLMLVIVILSPTDTFFFPSVDITAGRDLVVGVLHIMSHLAHFLPPMVSQY